jgi:hypothetical protein
VTGLSCNDHPAHSRQGRADDPLLRLVLQQNARSTASRPKRGCSGGSFAPAVHAATACEAAFEKMAGCHSQSLAHRPANLPALPAPDASACGD